MRLLAVSRLRVPASRWPPVSMLDGSCTLRKHRNTGFTIRIDALAQPSHGLPANKSPRRAERILNNIVRYCMCGFAIDTMTIILAVGILGCGVEHASNIERVALHRVIMNFARNFVS